MCQPTDTPCCWNQQISTQRISHQLQIAQRPGKQLQIEPALDQPL